MARIRRMGLFLILGFILIIYVALGFTYIQQGAKQGALEEQIEQLLPVVSKTMPGIEKLQAEYDRINSALAPPAVPDVLNIIVGIAEKSGIDVDPDAAMFHIPAPSSPAPQKVGEGDFQVFPFNSISVRGDYDSVMAFISDLDSGNTLETMVLKRVSITRIETGDTPPEEPVYIIQAVLDADLYTRPLAGD